MSTVLNELRLAARRLRGDRWAAGGALLAAALGAGLNTAVFAVAYGVLLRPLPYADAGRLFVVNIDTPFVTMREWREGLTSFASASGYARAQFTVYGAGEPRVVGVALVDDEFFATLGSPVRAGRVFGASDAAGAVVVSERFARQNGGVAGAVVGQRLTVGEAPLTVVGVMPVEFAFPSEQTDVWMPAAAAPAIAFDRSRDARRFLLVGRLRAGATLVEAREDVARVQARLDPATVRRQREPVQIASVHERVVGSVRPVLMAFAVAAAIVLLIACANVATILVGRTLGRHRELAVRRALGASSRQLFASILSESLLISVGGAVLGVAIAVVAVRLLARWAAGSIPRLGDVHLDWAVMGFTVAMTVLAALVSAVPAFRTAHRAAPTLRLGGWGSSRIDRRIRGGLIVLQVALAVVLLAGGALLGRTIVGLLGGELGVSAPGTVVTQLLLTTGTSFTAGDRGPLLDDVLQRVRALPGVTAAGAGSNLPPDNASIEVRVTLAGDAGAKAHMLSLGSATPGYLPAIGARLLEGRDFRDGDDRGAQLVAVISETAARELMPGATTAVERQLPFVLPGLRERGRATVIGIVSDIKYLGLEAPASPAIYVMWSHFPAGQTFLAVRTRESAAAMANSLRAILRERDARIPLMPVRTLEEVVVRSVADRRLRALLGGSVALLAFAVAMVGLAGSLMRVVSERRHELAIRAALGATPAHAVRRIVAEGAILAAIGVALGCAGALAVGRALRSLLHGVSPHDPATLATVCVFVAGASLLACYVPARRAARIDPLALLRE